VNFAYKARDLFFKDLNFEIPAGMTVAIVGTTGAGKSTIAKLLMRFSEPQSGAIFLDGKNISTLKVGDLRQAIGFVSQDVFLFSDTIASNISYGRSDVSINEIKQAARLAAADQFIESLPDGYQTMVGERGQRLSGGQKQRIGLARALLKSPPILVLDEATSAVDNETEHLIKESIESIRKGRTVIVIAHRLSTIRTADVILVMNDGQVVESGSYDELMAKGGVFARLTSV
jgi:ATP-binding cassette subfamily B protein